MHAFSTSVKRGVRRASGYGASIMKKKCSAMRQWEAAIHSCSFAKQYSDYLMGNHQ